MFSTLNIYVLRLKTYHLFKQMANSHNITKEMVLAELLKLWGPLRAEDQALLLEHIFFKEYKKNETIYQVGHTIEYIYCLMAGKVKIHKDGYGRNQILVVIKPVEFFGYRAYFAHEQYQTACSAFEPAVVATIPIEVMDKVIENNASVCHFFLRQVSLLLGSQYNRIVSLTQKHIRGRLAESILFLKNNYGIEEDGFTLCIYMGREDLASLSNMTTSNAIRTLSAFANEHIIAIDGRKIKIIDEEKLRKISENG